MSSKDNSISSLSFVHWQHDLLSIWFIVYYDIHHCCIQYSKIYTRDARHVVKIPHLWFPSTSSSSFFTPMLSPTTQYFYIFNQSINQSIHLSNQLLMHWQHYQKKKLLSIRKSATYYYQIHHFDWKMNFWYHYSIWTKIGTLYVIPETSNKH